MTALILHHFASSPFSEKIRRVLGFKKLACKSVLVPSVLPKPDVIALTGGYRKTPFLQIGADIYCDTALICDVLERIQPQPTLYPDGQQAMPRLLAQWADTTLFWAAVTYNRGPHGAGYKFGNVSGGLPDHIFEDRKAMGFEIDWLQPADAAPAYRIYLRRLDELLHGHPFLLGPRPCLADFSAFHPLWLAHLRALSPVDLLAQMPALQGWATRMQDIGLADLEEMDASQAIAIAAASTPAQADKSPLPQTAFTDEHGVGLGSPVSVMAESFGKEPTHGELIAATDSHYSLRRTDPRAGTVHVHFPRIGYVLKPA